jgi:HK97 gp10 family phage protein
MAKNVSVERFKKLTEELQKEVHELAVQELNAQAKDLADTIRSVAPIYKGPVGVAVVPGALKSTLRVIPGKTDTVVRVAAGGQATTHQNYDYARAVEFGTVNMKPTPFFFPTYRLRKKKIIAAMKRKITASIKKRSAE